MTLFETLYNYNQTDLNKNLPAANIAAAVAQYNDFKYLDTLKALMLSNYTQRKATGKDASGTYMGVTYVDANGNYSPNPIPLTSSNPLVNTTSIPGTPSTNDPNAVFVPANTSPTTTPQSVDPNIFNDIDKQQQSSFPWVPVLLGFGLFATLLFSQGGGKRRR